MLIIERAKVLKVMDVRVISDKFKVQEIVLEIDGKFPQPVIFQMINEKIDEISVKEGDHLTDIKFNLRGREWKNKMNEIKYFNSLDIWSASVDISSDSNVRKAKNPAESCAFSVVENWRNQLEKSTTTNFPPSCHHLNNMLR